MPSSGAGYATQTNGAATRAWYWTFPFIANTTEIPVFADCIWYDGWPHGSETPNATSSPASPASFTNHIGRFQLNRHNMATCISYLDGHGAVVPLKELWLQKWNTQWGSSAVGEGTPNMATLIIPK